MFQRSSLFVFLLLLTLGHAGTPPRLLTVPLPGAASHARLMWELSKAMVSRGWDVMILVENADLIHFSAALSVATELPKILTYDTGVSEQDWREGEQSDLFVFILRLRCGRATKAEGW
jgi:hypothetical protein